MYKVILILNLLKWFVILLKIKVVIGGISIQKHLYYKNQIKKFKFKEYLIMIVRWSNKDKRKNCKVTLNVKNANIAIKLSLNI